MNGEETPMERASFSWQKAWKLLVGGVAVSVLLPWGAETRAAEIMEGRDAAVAVATAGAKPLGLSEAIQTAMAQQPSIAAQRASLAAAQANLAGLEKIR